MKVLEGKDVDLIEPFPLTQLPATLGWLHCFKSQIFGDGCPKTDPEILMFMAKVFTQPGMRTWAIIDKANLTRSKSVAPIVGFYQFDTIGDNNGYLQVASSRKAWGERLASPAFAEQAGKMVVDEIFTTQPQLTRISASILANNSAAVGLSKRLGFIKDGYFKDMVTVNGKPQDAVHLGILRRTYGAV